MARPRNLVPSYRRHARSGKARVTVADHVGRPKEILLPGAYNSDESLKEYERLLGVLRIHHGKLPHPTAEADVTINELVLAYLERKVEVDYVDPEGNPTGEQDCQRQALAPLLRLFGSTAAKDFGSSQLKALQGAMASGLWLSDEDQEQRRERGCPIGWCRRLVNRNVGRIRGLFKWAVCEKYVPASLLLELQAVSPLKRGRGARESQPVPPVDPEVVQKTLPHLPPHVRDMVLFQLRTGARPGEVCAMRPRDIDRSTPVWVYRLANHKTAHHGHGRAIMIGPKAQEAIRRHLEAVGPDEFVFSPARQDAELKAAKRSARATKVQPSQVDRRKMDAKRKPAARYKPNP
jgi:integrase